MTAERLAETTPLLTATSWIAVAVLAIAVLALVGVLRSLRRERNQVATATEEAQRNESRFRLLAEAVPFGIFRSDAYGRVLYANPQLFTIRGGEGDPDADRPWLVAPEDEAEVQAGWADAAATRTTYRGRFRIRRLNDGELRVVRVEANPLVENDEVVGWVGSVVDVTDDATLENHLRRLSEILEATPDLVAMVDTDGRFEYLNAAARQLFRLDTLDKVRAMRGIQAYAPSSHQQFLDTAIPTAERQGVWVGEVSIALPDGGEMPASQVLVSHRRPDGSVEYYSSITRDLTERKTIEAQLEHAGLHDALTGLPNRVLLIDRLAHALSRAGRVDARVAVFSLDVDNFKLINDSYGHDVGDDLIVRAASRLANALQPGDTAARFGGDTFCILCEDVMSEEHALQIADRLAGALGAPYDIDGDRVFLTVSTGIALSGTGPATAETMLRDADAAMHRAKEKGRARHELFVEDVRYTAVNRLRTANDLHRALTEKEFRLVYQPEVRLSDGHISGVEALVRWHHPDRGLVPPSEFIPLAEQTGIIEGIGLWVLESALEQATEWSRARHDGSALTVWVNLSARQLGSERLVEQVASALERYGVDPAQLGLEITESALLEDAEGAVAMLGALRGLGVQLAVDDFGTGYSSLSYLKRLPIDAVKIDRSFVDGLATDGDDSAIVAAVTGMAQALRLSTIAEGVETREQLEALRRIGCELAQGYYFTTPQPPANISRLLESDRVGSLFAFDNGLDGVPQVIPAPQGELSVGYTLSDRDI